MRARFLAALLTCAVSCGEDADPARPEASPPSSTTFVDPRPHFTELEGFWTLERANTVLDRTERFEVAADPSSLTARERETLALLVRAGDVIDRVYQESLHAQALAVRDHLETIEVEESERARVDALRTLYALFAGPIASTPDGERAAFAPVHPYEPGRNVYPPGVNADAIRAYADSHTNTRIFDPRTVVRRRTRENLLLDRGRLRDHPAIAVLHPSLREALRRGADANAYYSVPYTLAYATENLQVYGLLREAADTVRADDADLADYLEQRAVDFLSNDYEGGDAAWVTGRYAHLNAQIGAYETYEDHLLGQKAFYSMSIFVRVPDASEELSRALERLSELEAVLPDGPYQRTRSEIPIGVYDVIADFGQARGANTATILPNEEHIARKYGRTILIRRNVLTNPALVASAQARFRAVIAEGQQDDLGDTGNFDRTVWHEVGHYLGPKRTGDGRTISEALGHLHNHFEELKADLISLFAVPRLVLFGVLDEERARAVYASGILRTLIASEPPRTSPYAVMELMQQNFFLEGGAITFADGRLTIDYARLPQVVETMLREVLRLQRAGDANAAQVFVDRWASWNPEIQGVLGAALDAVSPRYRLPRYTHLER
jgi:hypothetical protein